MKKKIICRSLFIVILLLPVIGLFFCIFRYGVNLVLADEWNVVYLYRDFEKNGFTFDKLFSQHNEHRVFFPQIIMLISFYFSGYNVKCVMYISACMLTLSYYFIVKNVVAKKILDSTGMNVIFSALLGFCIMSICQCENLLWGFQIAWILIEMSVIASLFFFVRYLECEHVKYCLISIIFATIATYSSLQGMAVWPMYVCIFIVILISKKQPLNWNLWIPYVTVGVLEMILYFYDYSSIEGHKQFQADGLRQCLDFMIIQIGYIFCDSNREVARVLGMGTMFLALFLICYLLKKGNIEEYLMPVGMIIYAMGVMLMISIGRSNLRLASRYTTYALMLLVGEILIIHKEIDKNFDSLRIDMKWQKIFIMIEGMLFALCIVESMDSLQLCKESYTARMSEKEALQNYRDVSIDELRKVYPWSTYEQAYEDIDFLAEKKWNAWENSHLIYDVIDTSGFKISDKPLNVYNIDFIGTDDQLRILMLQGWAVDDYSMKDYVNVYVKINNTVFGSKDHQERTDNVENFRNDIYKTSGFSFSKSTDVLKEKINTISLLLSASDGKIVYESPVQYIYYDKETGIYCCDEYGNCDTSAEIYHK